MHYFLKYHSCVPKIKAGLVPGSQKADSKEGLCYLQAS